MPRTIRQRIVGIMALVMTLSVVIASPATAFDDVPSGAYHGAAIDWMTDQAITAGTSASTFSPDREITRAEFATLLWRFSGSPDAASAESSFADMPVSGPFVKAINWVVASEITKGKSASTFAPNAAISRAEAVTYMWRYVCRPTTEAAPTFEDLAAGSFYVDAVAWAKAEGIVNGRSAATFDPNATLTRGDSAILLWRLAGKPASGEAGLNRSTKMPGCNLAPIAVDDAFETDEITPFSGNVLAANPTTADSDPDGDDITVIASDPDVLDADGNFDFDPNEMPMELAAGESITLELEYTISDPDGLTDSAVAYLTIHGINDAPVLDEIENATFDHGETATFTATATDPEDGPLTYSLVDAPEGATITEDGEFSWVVPLLETTADYSFDVVVTDDGELTDSQTVTFTVNAPESCVDGGVDNGVGTGDCYFAPADATVQERALAACESHFGVGECSIITGGYDDMQYGKTGLDGGEGSIHWHWADHPAGHCGPEYRIGDVIAPGWCGTIVGNFLDGVPA